MTDDEWNQGFARSLGAYLSGRGLYERDEYGKPVEDDDLLLLINAHTDVIPFSPAQRQRRCGVALDLDTDQADGMPAQDVHAPGSEYPLQGRSLALFVRPRAR
jgi:glycogen operon protein